MPPCRRLLAVVPHGSRATVLLQAANQAQLAGIRSGSTIRVAGGYQAAPRGRRGTGGSHFLATRIDVLAGPPGSRAPAKLSSASGGVSGGGGGAKPRAPFLVRQPLMLATMSTLWIPRERCAPGAGRLAALLRHGRLGPLRCRAARRRQSTPTS